MLPTLWLLIVVTIHGNDVHYVSVEAHIQPVCEKMAKQINVRQWWPWGKVKREAFCVPMPVMGPPAPTPRPAIFLHPRAGS